MQKKVDEFNKYKNDIYQKQMPTYARILDTQSELGELAKEYLKGSKYGTEDFVMTGDFLMEYGDVLYCLLSLAGELNIDAEKSLDMSIEKYKKRMESKKTMGSGK